MISIAKSLSVLLFALLVIELQALRIAGPSSKPGHCPRSRSLHRGSGNCAYSRDRCTSDYSCPGNKKCCQNGCAKRCVVPVDSTPKPGTCPPVPPTLPEVCERVRVRFDCSFDAECPGNKKCCSTMCGGRVCDLRAPPLTTPAPTQDPRCPAIPPSDPDFCALVDVVFECSSDSDCSSRDFCCGTVCGGSLCTSPDTPTIGPPITISPLPGPTCPAVPPFDPEFCARVGTLVECRSDSECDRGETCCGTLCGGSTCTDLSKPTDPTPTRDPRCPAVPPFDPEECARRGTFVECRSDSECSGGKTCCGTECGGTSCTTLGRPTPTPTSNPQCPPPTFPDICKVSFVVDQCQLDSECRGRKICCPAFCGANDCVNKARGSYY